MPTVSHFLKLRLPTTDSPKGLLPFLPWIHPRCSIVPNKIWSFYRRTDAIAYLQGEIFHCRFPVATPDVHVLNIFWRLFYEEDNCKDNSLNLNIDDRWRNPENDWPWYYSSDNHFPLTDGNIIDDMIPILAKRKDIAVCRHPIPYFTLLKKLIDDASVKYLVGQLTSATV